MVIWPKGPGFESSLTLRNRGSPGDSTRRTTARPPSQGLDHAAAFLMIPGHRFFDVGRPCPRRRRGAQYSKCVPGRSGDIRGIDFRSRRSDSAVGVQRVTRGVGVISATTHYAASPWRTCSPRLSASSARFFIFSKLFPQPMAPTNRSSQSSPES